MSERPAYRPSSRMLAVLLASLTGEGAVEGMEVYRCRRRGFLDHSGRVTPAGHRIVVLEAQRSQGGHRG